jgi:hypothetical protein
MKKSVKIIIAIGVIIAVVLVWGIIGSSSAGNIGTTCDFGIGEDGNALCWKWHRNTLGQVGDSLKDLLG